MLYIYLKELIKRIKFIIFGGIFSILLSVIFKEELIYIVIEFYFKIFNFQVLLLTGVFDKIYIELLIIYIIGVFSIILLILINLILFCISIITYNKLYIILKNLFYLIFILLFYFLINLLFLVCLSLLKNNNYYLYIQNNFTNEIRLTEYKNFIFILLLSNFFILFLGIFIFFSILIVKNITYDYIINIRLFNLFILSILLIFFIPPDYILHFIIVTYYFCYFEGLFIITIFLKQYNILIKNFN